jgi:hypothetical protein
MLQLGFDGAALEKLRSAGAIPPSEANVSAA